MSTYAKSTHVSQERSISEIRATLRRFGATGFGQLEVAEFAVLAFEKDGRHYKFVLPLPARKAFERVRVNAHATRQRTPRQIDEAYEQAIAERWRALALMIKGKMVGIELGIESFEDAFLGQTVMPEDGRTVQEIAQAQLADAYAGRASGPLLLAAPTKS